MLSIDAISGLIAHLRGNGLRLAPKANGLGQPTENFAIIYVLSAAYWNIVTHPWA
jgi:hypothetical protein